MKKDNENKYLHLDKESDEFKYVSPPSLFQMLKSFTKDTAKFVKNGAPIISKDDYAERLDACMGCEHVNKKSMRCGLCGCMLQMKARMKTAECPDKPSRWKEQIVDGKR